MAKTIVDNQLQIKVSLRKEGSKPITVGVKAIYAVNSDDVVERRELDPIVLTSTEEMALKNLGSKAITQIKVKEGIS